MALIALIAMICGPMGTPKASFIDESAVRNCYKEFLTCVERKQASFRVSDERALKECILEK